MRTTTTVLFLLTTLHGCSTDGGAQTDPSGTSGSSGDGTSGSSTAGSSDSGSSSDTATDCPPLDPMIDGIVLPSPEGVEFVSGVDNPFFPLPVGAVWEFAGMTTDGMEEIHVEVLAETVDLQGVTATVVYDLVRLDGEIIEETWDWYAQDVDGNVWYLGEDSCEFVDGVCDDHHGSWTWGVDCAVPGYNMPAQPMVDGQPYFQEYSVGEAEDVGEVIAIDESIEVAAGMFEDCIRTHDTSHVEATADEEKVYCPGVGNVFEHAPDGDIELLSFTMP
jgi:hypothetical protein